VTAVAPTWSRERLERDRREAVARFREERVTEPHADYLELFETSRATMVRLLAVTEDLAQLRALASEVLGDRELAEAVRYLASPPMSKDDLETVAEVTMAPARVSRDPARAERLLEVILAGLDRQRFPWFGSGRAPTAAERDAAVLASAALRATRLAETRRRTQGKREQEEAVRRFLSESGLQQVPTQPIPTLHRAPPPGTFCGEVLVGSRRSDVPVRLWDGRLMPTECKVSNSATNSYKRINNDAAVKAVVWRDELGPRNCVPVAILSGVFARETLEYAQDRGLTLFWAFDLDPLREFVDGTREGADTGLW
jgi:hypothetical protein